MEHIIIHRSFISNSNMILHRNSDFIHFIKKTFIVIAPVIVIFAILDAVTFFVGELLPVENVVDVQNSSFGENILYGRKSVDQELRKYKYIQHKIRQSNILAVGSSRTLSIREEFFSPYYSFTNVGSIAHNLGDVDDFVNRLATSTSPKYVFLAPDYYWFGKKRAISSELTKDINMLSVTFDWKAHIFASRYFLSFLVKNGNDFFQSLSSQNKFRDSYGFQGIRGDGYRSDGSYRYGTFIAEMRAENVYRDREQPPIIERIRSGAGSYAFDSEFDDARVNMLNSILQTLSQKGYIVIGLSLPFSSEVYKELNTNPRHKELFASYQQKIPQIFKMKGFEYFDYSNLESLKLDDTYMFDGVHPSETAMVYMMIDMLQRLKDGKIQNKEKIIDRLMSFVNSPRSTSFEIDDELISAL